MGSAAAAVGADFTPVPFGDVFSEPGGSESFTVD
jgi:hypothetical protein